MKLSDINPYVRFARVQKNRMPLLPAAAPDHRIFYCQSGSITLTVSDTAYHLKKGSLIFWRAGMTYQTIDDGSPYVLLGCNFDFFMTAALPKAPVSYLKSADFDKNTVLENALPDNLAFIPDCLFLEYAPLEEKFEEIITEYTQKELFCEERCSALLKDIIICAVRLYTAKENRTQKSKTDRILEYIREHYNENITNSHIAKEFSYHPNYISSLIKKRTGMPLHKYLLEYRIHMAIIYLQSASSNITEVAARVGFDDVKHFSKCFKNITGNVPSSYTVKG